MKRIEDFKWAKTGNAAFSPSLAHRNAVEVFVMPREGTYTWGFKRAADMIVDAAPTDGLNPDDLFFPVAFLYRHHLELMLKDVIRLGVQVGALTGCEESLGEHNLHKLWNKAKQLLQVMWPDSSGEDLTAAEQLILEFHRLDPSGQAFRYVRNTKGVPHLQGAPDRVDLTNMKATMQAVSSFLDALYAGLEYCDPGSP